MPSYQSVEVLGHIGRDPETKYTQSGVPKTTFSVAVSERWKDKQTGEVKEKTEWFSIVAWRKEWLAERIRKGDLVMVKGKIESREYTDRDGVKRRVSDLVADTVLPLHGRKADGVSGPNVDVPVDDNRAAVDDDVPF